MISFLFYHIDIMVKIICKSSGSLFHYAHFVCDVLFPEINLKMYEKSEVFRIKSLKQTLGNFGKLYEEIMGIKNIEISPKLFETYEGEKIIIKRNKRAPVQDFNFFRDFILNRYKIKPEKKYPEIILIERGERIELINDPVLQRSNDNYTTGKERREIEHIDELKKFLESEFKNKFKTLILEKIPFSEQVKYFYNAKMIIGIHGAALSNMFFCNPKTKILEVLGDRVFPFFDVISNKLNLQHFKCENNLSTIKLEILKIWQQKEPSKESILQTITDFVISKKIEISKNKSINTVPTIFYIGMEKTGSKSILFGFPKHMVAHWHSTTYFEQKYNTKLLSKNNLDLYDLAIYIGKKYNFKPLIIECIREPISQLISAIMQHLKKFNKNNCKCQYCVNVGKNEKFIELIKKNISVDNWLNFKDRGFQSLKLWKKHFDINLLDVFQRHNCYYELEDIKVLLIKLEDSEKRTRLFEKIGYTYKETFFNQTENNGKVGDIYKYIKDNLRFTEEELDNIYINEVAVFYKEQEISIFREKWLKKN